MTQASPVLPDSAAEATAPERTFDEAVARVPLWTLLPVVVLPFGVVVGLVEAAEKHSSWFSALPAGSADVVQSVALYGSAFVWWLGATSAQRHSLGELIGRVPSASDWKVVGLATVSQGCIGMAWILFSLQVWGAPFGWGVPEATPRPAGLFRRSATACCWWSWRRSSRSCSSAASFFESGGRSWGLVAGALGSSFAFGVVHFDILGASLAGITLLLVYTRTRSLWAAIAVHAIHNACCLAMQYWEWLAPEHEERFFAQLTSAPNDGSWGYTVCWALLALSLVWLGSFLRR